MILRNSYCFYVKRWLGAFCVLALLATVMFASLSTPSYAMPTFGEDCRSCHQSGIAVSTNATGVVHIGKNATFWLEVSATGGTSRGMMLVWSKVAHNTYFTFTPKEVEDNSLNDRQSDGGKITALFKISAPALEGDYIISTYAASADGKGGFVEVKVAVGAGGEIPKSLLEIVMGWLTTVVTKVLAGVAILGIVLYVVVWRRIPGGADSW